MTDIDPSLYVRSPQGDVASTVALGVSLLAALPKDAPDSVKAAAKKLRASVVALQAAWNAATPAAPAVNRRAADSAIDNGWGCLEARLAAYARLPAEHHPKAARAAEIHGALFEGGLDFLTLPYKSQWAEGDRRLQLIEQRGYEADIDALCGHEFLAEVRRTQKHYGQVLGITKAEEVPAEVSLLEPLRDVGRAVVDHSLQLLAWGSGEPKASAKVKRALKPIDDQRAAAARRAGDDGAEKPAPEPAVTPQTPVLAVPA